jgi:hypothetical protein
VQRSSTKTRMKENERIVATAPLNKYEDGEVVNRFLKCMRGSPDDCGAALTGNAIVPFSPPRLQEKLYPTCFMTVNTKSLDIPPDRLLQQMRCPLIF